MIKQTASATLGALNAAVTLDITNEDGAVFVLPALTATVTFEMSQDGSTWTSLGVIPLASTTPTTAVVSVVNPTAGVAHVLPHAHGIAVRWVRARVSAYTSGTGTGTIQSGNVGF